MKVFKKILGCSVALAAIITIAGSHVSAEKLSDYAKSDEPLINLSTGTDLVVNKRRIETLYNGNLETSGSSPYQKMEWNHNSTYWADFKVGDSVKVVSFQSSDEDSWTNMTTLKAAKAWENKNPGWKVFAAINGDFFDINSSKAPTGICVAEGDLLQATVGEPNAIGWKADGTFIFGQPKVSSSMYLEEYNEAGEISSSVEIAKVNPEVPSSTGIDFYATYGVKNVDFTGAKVLECTYSIYRLNKHGRYFVKGTIDKALSTSSITDYTGKFYLVSKDGSLDKYSTGTTVRVTHKLLDEWADVVNASGCGAVVLKDGVPQAQGVKSDSNATTHPRTMVGIRPDKSMVFLTCDGRGKEEDWEVGATTFQEGEMLRLLGCVDGYNLDGGGSTTLVYRNIYGDLQVANRPSDGSERSDGNHLFLVKKDPGFKISIDNNYSTSTINFKIGNEECFKDLSNIKVTINNETKPYDANGVKFGNLKLNTEYEIKISYEMTSIVDSSKRVSDSMVGTFTTQGFDVPYINFYVTDIGKDHATLKHDPNPAVKNVVVSLGTTKYQMGSADELEIIDLIEDTDNVLNISFDYEDTANPDPVVAATTFHVDLDPITFHTILYNLPEITKFEQGKVGSDYVRIEYAFTDEGEMLEEAYFKLNGEKVSIEPTKLSGNYKFENLDLEEKEYTISLVIKYGSKVIESSELKFGKEADPIIDDPIDPGKSGCGKSAIALVLSITTIFTACYIILKKRA